MRHSDAAPRLTTTPGPGENAPSAVPESRTRRFRQRRNAGHLPDLPAPPLGSREPNDPRWAGGPTILGRVPRSNAVGGRLAQLVRAPALQAGGRRFEPGTAHCLRSAAPRGSQSADARHDCGGSVAMEAKWKRRLISDGRAALPALSSPRRVAADGLVREARRRRCFRAPLRGRRPGDPDGGKRQLRAWFGLRLPGRAVAVSMTARVMRPCRQPGTSRFPSARSALVGVCRLTGFEDRDRGFGQSRQCPASPLFVWDESVRGPAEFPGVRSGALPRVLPQVGWLRDGADRERGLIRQDCSDEKEARYVAYRGLTPRLRSSTSAPASVRSCSQRAFYMTVSTRPSRRARRPELPADDRSVLPYGPLVGILERG
jgi:hypothetical protein